MRPHVWLLVLLLSPSPWGLTWASPPPSPVSSSTQLPSHTALASYLHPDSVWPQSRRDPRHSGCAFTIATQDRRTWNTSSQPWRTRTGKGLFTTPVLGPDDQVLVGSADRWFYALSSATGDVLWRFETGDVLDTAAAVTHDGRVVVAAADGFVYCLDLRTGGELWRFRAHHAETEQGAGEARRCALGAPLHAASVLGYALGLAGGVAPVRGGPSNWFEGHVTLAEGGRVLVGNDNYRLYSLSPAGEEEFAFWPGPLPIGTIWSAPYARPDGSAVITSMDFGVYSVSATGECQWRTYLNGPSSSTPLADLERGLLYVGSWDSRLYALRDDTGEIVWTVHTNDHIYGSPAQGPDGTLYVGSTDSFLYAIDPDTGSVRWRYATKGPIRCSPAVSGDGIVYFGTGAGVFHAVTADGKCLWRFNAAERERVALNTSPVIGRTRIVFGSQDGSVISIPHGYCLSPAGQADKRCLPAPSSAAAKQSSIRMYNSGGQPFEDGATLPKPFARGGALVFSVRHSLDDQPQTLSCYASDVSITASPELPNLKLSILSAGGLWLVAEPTEPLAPATSYQLSVSGSFASEDGSTVPISASFGIATAPTASQPGLASLLNRLFVLRDLSPYLPALTMSLNQLGFESLELMARVLNVDEASRSFVAVLGGGKTRASTGRASVDSATATLGLLTGRVVDGDTIELDLPGVTIVTGGPPMRVQRFHVAGTLEKADALHLSDGASVVSSTSCFTTVETLMLYLWGLCDDSDAYQTIGTVNMLPLSDFDDTWARSRLRVVRPPSYEARAVLVQRRFCARVGGTTVSEARAHLLTISLVDADSGAAVSFDYLRHTEVTTAPEDDGVDVCVYVPREKDSLPERVKAYLVGDLTVIGDMVVLEGVRSSTVFAEVTTVPLFTVLVLALWYALLRPLSIDEGGRAWILTWNSGLFLSVAGAYATYHGLLRNYSYDYSWGESAMARWCILYFATYLVLDIMVGLIDYPNKLDPVTGWGHHVGYFVLSLWLLYAREGNVLMVFMLLELPTIVLSAGHFSPRLRSDWLFGWLFFLTRLCYHPWMIYQVWDPEKWSMMRRFIPLFAGTAALVMHMLWFRAWVAGMLRRRRRKAARLAKEKKA